MRQRLALAGFIGFLFFLVALFYFVPSNPDIESVLAGKAKSGGTNSLILFSLFAFALATVTYVKSNKRFKRGQDCQREQLYIKIDELILKNRVLEGKNKELKQDREQLFTRANELEERSKQPGDHEKLLHQSILVLKKDIDNLLSQRDRLMESLNLKEAELKKIKEEEKKKEKKKKQRRKNAKN
ncbi:hypothetical protein A2276_06510 [candidate division WOR-1 bacterium RIFOXYA12_FULL_43_27]|uniref:Uncharacterized protein n=1 Tax=candidate division WOR-1 bacterium RIFOXYC2_FULL_46_14 TaxID=1802587 RepID=A0A1F4U5D2_UNCSA|nr:MAG: hypothetical protein A2276_06510 [candidate division WOR-1 bacterium RIFOXYA12_FULL_43_27]OGC20300.1 MAG: hypothetical protein A2292_04510 [candidate division WOR-1 bacterium RIFOXYB2_FULL_46_45]OGC31963.1 MAG: hypothetical protein A2232_06940 [candidate division WOR-1 bacterium RIFOXYA2_FULL_46_56]OGC40146.1 MAG: hypothetical protein A2438_02530 [candidate division WOR-1 bacterium RIFOXYC2_FULL_46_14]